MFLEIMTERKPYISVVMPLYNKEAIVARSVESVLCQGFPDFELVIVDDGSTDYSAKIVSSIHDDRIVFIQQENGGPGAARNTGVRQAKADRIVFLDADDELLPDALEHFAALSRQMPDVDIFNSTYYIRCKDEKRFFEKKVVGIVKNVMKACFYGEVMPGGGSSMFKKSLLEKYPYDIRIRRFEDAELLIRLLPYAKVYSDNHPVWLINQDYAAASRPRKNIEEDYIGHLNFSVKGFWTRMCIYRTFIENWRSYPVEMHQLYPQWFHRYDMLLLYKLLTKLKL